MSHRTPPSPFATSRVRRAAGSMLFPGIVRQLLADSGRSARTAAAAFPGQGEARHLPVHDRWRVACRYLGPEARTDRASMARRSSPIIRRSRTGRATRRIFLKRPQWEFAPHGQCGTEVSTLFPHMAECVDDIALIRSMHTSHTNHYNATLGMHTGSFTFARPSIGSWVSYGLGTLNRNLPCFVVIAPAQTYAGTQVYASDFLPGAHQGTLVVPGPNRSPISAPRVASDRQQTRTGRAAPR